MLREFLGDVEVDARKQFLRGDKRIGKVPRLVWDRSGLANVSGVPLVEAHLHLCWEVHAVSVRLELRPAIGGNACVVEDFDGVCVEAESRSLHTLLVASHGRLRSACVVGILVRTSRWLWPRLRVAPHRRGILS